MGKPNTVEVEGVVIAPEEVVAIEPLEETTTEQPLEEQEKVSVLLDSGERVEVEGEAVPELIEAVDAYLEEQQPV